MNKTRTATKVLGSMAVTALMAFGTIAPAQAADTGWDKVSIGHKASRIITSHAAAGDRIITKKVGDRIITRIICKERGDRIITRIITTKGADRIITKKSSDRIITRIITADTGWDKV